jgi:hypothetical protein
MPYIVKKDRTKIDEALKPIHKLIYSGRLFTGDYNYIITSIVHRWIKDSGLSYGVLNAVIGVLSCVKQEFYRVIAGPYEDKKRLENGSVSEFDDNSREKMR